MFNKAKKSLGQNFLKSKPALNMMCTASDLNENDVVLEVGPGKGALTEKLLEKAKQVIAVEKDRELFEFLSEKFENEIKSNKLILIEGDILELQITNFELRNYKIIANIPYNITGAILKKFLTEKIQPTIMTLLVQKEVAERIVARDGKESILSLSVKAYGNPKYIMKVEKRFFSPAPKVDSAIISIKNISRKNFKSIEEEKLFFEIIKAGFAHKRKVLIKNLSAVKIGNKNWEEIFKKLEINSKIRAENVPLEKWLEIINNFSKNS